MKKILIATTALVATAGVAAAEISLSGTGRFGLQYDSAGWGNGSKTALEKRMTINIDGKTTADNGVTFGGRIRIRSDEGSRQGGSNTAINGARVYAQSGGLTVAAGNILGAIESMPGLYAPSVGLTGLGWNGLVTNTVANGYFNWDAYDSRGNGSEGIELLYSMGDFKGHISYSSRSLARIGNAGLGTKNIEAYGAYTFSGWTVALGVQDSDDNTADKVVLTVGGKIGDFGVGFGAAQNGKGATKATKFAVNASYTMAATTISGYIAKEKNQTTAFGLGASYNMGGGARIVGGIERTPAKTTRADVGVAFNF